MGSRMEAAGLYWGRGCCIQTDAVLPGGGLRLAGEQQEGKQVSFPRLASPVSILPR